MEKRSLFSARSVAITLIGFLLCAIANISSHGRKSRLRSPQSLFLLPKAHARPSNKISPKERRGSLYIAKKKRGRTRSSSIVAFLFLFLRRGQKCLRSHTKTHTKIAAGESYGVRAAPGERASEEKRETRKEALGILMTPGARVYTHRARYRVTAKWKCA